MFCTSLRGLQCGVLESCGARWLPVAVDRGGDAGTCPPPKSPSSHDRSLPPVWSPSAPRRILTKYEHHQQTLANQAALSRTPSPSPQSTLLPDVAGSTPGSSDFPATLTLPPPSDAPFEPLDPSHPDYSPYAHTEFFRRISDLIKDPKSLFHRREWSEEGYVPPGSEAEVAAAGSGAAGVQVEDMGRIGKGEPVEHIEEGEGLEVRFREMGLEARRRA